MEPKGGQKPNVVCREPAITNRAFIVVFYKEMIWYCESKTKCRRDMLLTYFGQENELESCQENEEKCDKCSKLVRRIGWSGWGDVNLPNNKTSVAET